MTDHPISDDELVSAVLDGEASPEEVVRVERDPALRARRDALAAAAAAVGQPVAPLEEASVDEVVARAVAAAPSRAAPAAAPGPATVVPLSAARTRRAWLIAAAAAVVVLALVGIPLALSDDDDHDQFAAVGSAVSGDAAPTAEGTPTTLAPSEPDSGADDATTFDSDGARATEEALPPANAASPDAPTGATVGLAPAGTITSDTELLAWAEALGIPATAPDRPSVDAAMATLAAPAPGAPPACVTAARTGSVAGWARATSATGPAVVQVVPVVAMDGLRTVLVLVDATTCVAILTESMPVP